MDFLDTKLQNIRSRGKQYETFRTPLHAYSVLYDYCPEWFEGSAFDPSAGDGRMIKELIRRGNNNHHFVCDIREEEKVFLDTIPNSTVIIDDYLKIIPPESDFMITNPPFTLSQAFVDKALTHTDRVFILQSISWQGTFKRSVWLRKSCLSMILNLPLRPKWEVLSGDFPPSNIWDYAWFVFDKSHVGLPKMDWLLPVDNLII